MTKRLLAAVINAVSWGIAVVLIGGMLYLLFEKHPGWATLVAIASPFMLYAFLINAHTTSGEDAALAAIMLFLMQVAAIFVVCVAMVATGNADYLDGPSMDEKISTACTEHDGTIDIEKSSYLGDDSAHVVCRDGEQFFFD